jgi:hypothetical protein
MTRHGGIYVIRSSHTLEHEGDKGEYKRDGGKPGRHSS